MKISILGTRGKIKPTAERHSLHTGILLDDTILVDIGQREYLDHQPEAIVFTHFHPDHAYFVESGETFTPGIPIFGPEQHELVPKLRLVRGSFRIGDYDFRPIPVIHALRLKSLGYLITKGDQRILITGAVAWIEKEYLADLPQVDLVITEASYINRGGRINRKKDRIFGHTGAPDLVRLLGPLTSKLVFLHYGSWFYNNIPESKERLSALSDEITIIPAHDGMEIEL